MDIYVSGSLLKYELQVYNHTTWYINGYLVEKGQMTARNISPCLRIVAIVISSVIMTSIYVSFCHVYSFLSRCSFSSVEVARDFSTKREIFEQFETLWPFGWDFFSLWGFCKLELIPL